jgi:DNA-binding protein
MIAGIRLAREKQVNVRVIPTGRAIEESVEVAHEVFNRVFRRVPEKMGKA